MKVGDFVKYIRKDSVVDRSTGYYPPIGTIGRVIETSRIIRVQWPEGSTTAGAGYIEETDVEVVPLSELMKDGMWNFIKTYEYFLTKEDVCRIILHYDFAVQNFCKHYVGMSEDDYRTIIDNMTDHENAKFVDNIISEEVR